MLSRRHNIDIGDFTISVGVEEDDCKKSLPPGANAERQYKKRKSLLSNEKVEVVYTESKSFIREMLDFSLLRNSDFLVNGICTMLMNVGLFTFFSHSTNRALHFNIPYSQASLIPTIIALGTAPSWLLFWFIADELCQSCTSIRNWNHFGGGGGLTEMTFIFSTTFPLIAIHCAAFGFANGMFLSIQSTVIVDMLGVERIAKSQAILGVFVGISCLYATPLAGRYVYSKNYKYASSGNHSVRFRPFSTVDILFMYVDSMPIFLLNLHL